MIRPQVARYLFVLTMMLVLGAVVADARKKINGSAEARELFERAYNQVFGDEGCTLHYEVNLVSLYKTSGTIWYKGKKSKFVDPKVDSYNDGKTVHMVYRKKKVVEIYDAQSGSHDKYASKFKFTLDDFDYEIMERFSGYVLLRLRQRKEAKGTIKEARFLLEEKTLTPVSAKLKVAFFWATITISNFKAGGISDDTFVFPRQQYDSGYKYVDKR